MTAEVVFGQDERHLALSSTGRRVWYQEKRDGWIVVKTGGHAPLTALERHELAELMVEAWREWGGLTL